MIPGELLLGPNVFCNLFGSSCIPVSVSIARFNMPTDTCFTTFPQLIPFVFDIEEHVLKYELFHASPCFQTFHAFFFIYLELNLKNS